MPIATAPSRPRNQLAEPTTGGHTLLVVDDAELVHAGLRLVLSREPELERCVPARSGREAIGQLHRHRPSVCLLDVWVGSEPGVEICRRLRALEPSLRILFMSGGGGLSSATASAVGAVGFVSKGSSAAEIATAVRAVARGATYFPQGRAAPSAAPISSHERSMLEMLAAGATNREIAAKTHLSPETVKGQLSLLFRKLRARNRAQAVYRAARRGLI